MKKLLTFFVFAVLLVGCIFVGFNKAYANPVIQLGGGKNDIAYDLNSINAMDLKECIYSSDGNFEVWCNTPEEVSDFEDKLKDALKNENIFIIYHKKWYYDDGSAYFKIEVLDGNSEKAQEEREDIKKSIDRVFAAIEMAKSLKTEKF